MTGNENTRSELAVAAAELVDVVHATRVGAPCAIDVPSSLERVRRALANEDLLRERIYTVAEVAALWNVHPETVRGLIEDGALEGFNVGRGTVKRWRIPARWVAEAAGLDRVPRDTSPG